MPDDDEKFAIINGLPFSLGRRHLPHNWIWKKNTVGNVTLNCWRCLVCNTESADRSIDKFLDEGKPPPLGCNGYPS